MFRAIQSKPHRKNGDSVQAHNPAKTRRTKKRPRFDSEVDMFHLVASMFADDVPVTTPTKRPTMPEPNAPKRLCVKAVRRVGENPHRLTLTISLSLPRQQQKPRIYRC